MVHDVDSVLGQVQTWRAAGLKVAVATVVQTWGSSPRPAGSKLAVNERGEFVGSVSGGCIEGAVIAEALEVMAGAPTRVVGFGVSDAQAWEVGLACGGKIEILVEQPQLIAELLAARTAKQAVALATPLDGSPARLLETSETLRDDRARVIDGALVEPHNPPLRLIVVGAVHVAEPLAKLARIAGFAVTVVDPRRAWATPARFPDEQLVVEWPDTAIARLAPDARTAVVTLTHDPKLDDPALIAALATPAFYLGCLGSTKTHAARLERLAGKGDLARLHGPVGLAIAARTPAEIAVSIMAEIIAVLRT